MTQPIRGLPIFQNTRQTFLAWRSTLQGLRLRHLLDMNVNITRTDERNNITGETLSDNAGDLLRYDYEADKWINTKVINRNLSFLSKRMLATGTTQATANPIPNSPTTRIIAANAIARGVILPDLDNDITEGRETTGFSIFIANDTGVVVDVYPHVGGRMRSVSFNVPFTMAARTAIYVRLIDVGIWYAAV